MTKLPEGLIDVGDPDAPLAWNPRIVIEKRYDRRYTKEGWLVHYTPPQHRTRVTQFRYTHEMAIELADEIIDDSNRYVNGKEPHDGQGNASRTTHC